MSDDDIIPLHDQKSKLKVFEKIISLISLLTEQNSIFTHRQHHNFTLNDTSVITPSDKIMVDAEIAKNKSHNTNQKLNLNFFYKSILDKTNLKDVGNILFSLMRTNLCRNSHLSDEQKSKKNHHHHHHGHHQHHNHHSLASKFVNMCCKSIKRLQEKNVTSENERCVPFFKILWNFSLLKNTSPSSSAQHLVESDLEIIETDNEVSIRNSAQNDDCPSCRECQENKVDFTALILG